MDANVDDIKAVRVLFRKGLYREALQDMSALELDDLNTETGVQLLAKLINDSSLRGAAVATLKQEWTAEFDRMKKQNSAARVARAKVILTWLNVILRAMKLPVRQPKI
jgi:hypothetical protein